MRQGRFALVSLIGDELSGEAREVRAKLADLDRNRDSRHPASGAFRPRERQGGPVSRNALRIERAFGVSMDTLLRMQAWHHSYTVRWGNRREAVRACLGHKLRDFCDRTTPTCATT